MGEQSHKEAMREAIRGDLERARSRNPSIFERPAPPPVEIRGEQSPASDPEPPHPPSNDVLQATAGPETAVEPVIEPEADVEQEPEVEAEAEVEAQPVVEAPEPVLEKRTGLLARLAFWRR